MQPVRTTARVMGKLRVSAGAGIGNGHDLFPSPPRRRHLDSRLPGRTSARGSRTAPPALHATAEPVGERLTDQLVPSVVEMRVPGHEEALIGALDVLPKSRQE